MIDRYRELQIIQIGKDPVVEVSFKPGEMAQYLYPFECSACRKAGKSPEDSIKENVRAVNITTHADGWHGWWRCEECWDRAVLRGAA